MALLLMFVLSITAVFADSGLQDEGAPAEGTQTEQPEVTAEEGSETQDAETQDGEETPAQEPEGSIIKKGKHYYYMDPDGVIQKKAGFITIGKKIYYAGKGGRIKTRETFRVKRNTTMPINTALSRQVYISGGDSTTTHIAADNGGEEPDS